jgi:hypothetical protein
LIQWSIFTSLVWRRTKNVKENETKHFSIF